MSHLQPSFIAKTKGSLKKSQAPRAMPRGMIADIAASMPCAKRKDKDPWWKTWGIYPPDYRIFTLRK